MAAPDMQRNVLSINVFKDFVVRKIPIYNVIFDFIVRKYCYTVAIYLIVNKYCLQLILVIIYLTCDCSDSHGTGFLGTYDKIILYHRGHVAEL